MSPASTASSSSSEHRADCRDRAQHEEHRKDHTSHVASDACVPDGVPATPRTRRRQFTHWKHRGSGRETTCLQPVVDLTSDRKERAWSINAGDTAWVLTATALVLFMTPGLAFFYGGMVRGKNVLGMLMQNFFAMGLIGVLWAVVGFSLAFGDGGGFIGNFDFAFMKDVRRSTPTGRS